MLSRPFLGSLATLLLISIATATTIAPDCPCFTQTTSVYPSDVRCPNVRCGPRPLCLRLQEITIPGPNPTCLSTPTVTVTRTCTTTCQRGCGTSFKTVTADSPCLAAGQQGTGTPTFPFSPITPTPTPPRATRTGQTMIPAPTSSCWTYTYIPPMEYCPGPRSRPCAEPACVLLKTITFPAKRTDCPTTPTVTATPSCIQGCRRGCGTAYKTVTLKAAGEGATE